MHRLVAGDREIEFSIFINKEEWVKLNPHEKTYADNRTYTQFDPVWTSMVNEKIWRTSRLPCKWSFTHLKFHSLGNFAAFTFEANCTARTDNNRQRICGNFLKGKCREIQGDSDIKIEILTSDTKHIPHHGKRKIAGEFRKEIKRSLKNVKASKYRVNMANELMESSDVVPAHLPNLPTVRKMAQERRDESLRMDLYPGEPLSSLKKMYELNSFIRSLFDSPFDVQFVTDDQIKLYREAVALGFGVISIDASGFSKAFDISDGIRTGALFLYEISMNIFGKIVSAGSRLTEAHDTNKICDWLFGWLELVVDRPKAIVADGSLALLNGIALAFYDWSYDDHLEECYKMLLAYEKIMEILRRASNDHDIVAQCEEDLKRLVSEKPDVLLFRDRNHIIKNVRNWTCFEKCPDWRVSDFYTRIIGYILNISNFKLFKDTIRQVFIVCNSDFIKPTTDAAEALQTLIEKIETFNYDVSYSEDGKGSNQGHYTSSLNQENISSPVNSQIYGFKKLIDDIYNDSLKYVAINRNISGFPDPNPYKCTGVVEFLKVLFYQFLTYTNVLDSLPFYEDQLVLVKTSCNSETRNKILKTDYGLKLFTVHKCVLYLVKTNSGECLLARAELRRQRQIAENAEKIDDKEEQKKLRMMHLPSSPFKSTNKTGQMAQNYGQTHCFTKSLRSTSGGQCTAHQYLEKSAIDEPGTVKYCGENSNGGLESRNVEKIFSLSALIYRFIH